MKPEHTIESGLEALLTKARFHREQAERFDRLAIAFREAEAALHDGNGSVAKPIGRPVKEADRAKLAEAIRLMPSEFSLPQIKKAAGLRIDVFRRLFRDCRKNGVVIEKIKATGRQQGLYAKNEKAAAGPDSPAAAS